MEFFFGPLAIGAVLLLLVGLPAVFFVASRDRARQTKNPAPAMDRFLDGSPVAVVQQAAFDIDLGEITRMAEERGYEYVQTAKGPIGMEHTFRKVTA